MRLFPIAVALFASLFAVACASSSDEAQPSDSSEASEAEMRASCTNPRKYFATFRDGANACKPIAGKRGQWLPEPLFTDAPAEIQASTCSYRWSSAGNFPPDADAIKAKVTWANGLAASCGTSSEPDVGQLQPIPYIDNWTQAGSVGCDVCGVLKNGKIWVVLPPERIFRRQFAVGLSNGETRSFEIAPTNARALTIQLPPPPAGARYKQGHVQIL